ncbi:MAG: hypothetical protein OHK0021_04870 [Bryobacter sp.]
MKFAFLSLMLAVAAFSQTKIDGTRQFRLPDFSNQIFARPWPVGSNLPQVCQIGEAYFQDNLQVGRKLYLCTQTNIWTEVNASAGGGGGSVGQTADLLDWQLVKSGPAQLQIGAACTASKPCRARFGNRTILQTETITANISGLTATGNLFLWLDETGVRLGHNTAATVTCNGNCSVTTAITEFPGGVIPLAVVPFSSNVLADLTAAMDWRAFLSNLQIEPGNSGNVTIFSDGSTGKVSVDLAPELDFGGMTSTKVTKRGTQAARPATCTPGELYYQTDQTVGLYHCPTQDQWAILGGAASGGSLQIQNDGAATGSRPNLNLAPGAGVSVICADDPANDRVSCTFAANSVDLNSEYARLGSVTNTYAAGHISDFRAASELYLPLSPTANPTASGQIVFETNSARTKMGNNGTTETLPFLSETVTTAGASGLLTVSGGGPSTGRTIDVSGTPDFGNLTSVKPFKRGTALPATCEVGDAYQLTNATASSQFFLCTSTDNWTAQGAGQSTQAVNITLSSAGTVSASSTSYITSGTTSFAGTRTDRRAYTPFAIVIDRLYAITATSQPGSAPTDDLVCRVSVDDSDSVLSVTIPGGSAAGVYSDLTNAIPIPAGSYWQIGCQNSATSNSASIRGFAVRISAQ